MNPFIIWILMFNLKILPGLNLLINAYVANGGWVPRSQGLVPPTQTQVGRTPHKPALPTTQPRALPATQPQP